jgi:hypothetical protein
MIALSERLSNAQLDGDGDMLMRLDGGWKKEELGLQCRARRFPKKMASVKLPSTN